MAPRSKGVYDFHNLVCEAAHNPRVVMDALSKQDGQRAGETLIKHIQKALKKTR
jgi:hypothetical protein